jgi:hypothetical protein
MMNRTLTKLFVFCSAMGTLAVFSGCEKDKETIATILVVNDEGDPVPSATVRLFSNPSPGSTNNNALRFDTTGMTNGTGKLTINFTEFYKKGQAGFAVLDIEVTKGNLAGTGIIKIEEETTTEEAVTVE